MVRLITNYNYMICQQVKHYRLIRNTFIESNVVKCLVGVLIYFGAHPKTVQVRSFFSARSLLYFNKKSFYVFIRVSSISLSCDSSTSSFSSVSFISFLITVSLDFNEYLWKFLIQYDLLIIL